jgi:hypothetical protein
VIGVRRRGFGGGRDALDQCAVGFHHHGPGSRTIPESNACASDVLGDACLGDAVYDALYTTPLRISALSASAESPSLGASSSASMVISPSAMVIADAGTGLIAMRPW